MIGGFALDAHTQAMIDSLERPEERERLTRFLMVDLQDGKGTGILYDWFLCVKANRLFMEKQPAHLNREVIQPLIENCRRVEAVVTSVLRGHQEGMVALERGASHAESAAQRIEKIVPQIETAVQTAFVQIDTKPLSKAITETVMKSTVEPIAKTNEKLETTLEVLQEVLRHTEAAIKTLSVLSLPGIAGVAFVAALLVCGSISALIVERIHSAYDTQLATAFETNGATFAQLSKIHAKVEIAPQGDSQGNPLPGCWALSVDGAEQAQMKSNDPRQRGVIFFRQTD